MRAAIALAWLLFQATEANAHEMTLAYLGVSEETVEGDAIVYSIVLRTPVAAIADIDVVLPADCARVSPTSRWTEGSTSIVSWKASCRQPMRGRALGVEGLSDTVAELFVRFDDHAGIPVSARLAAGTATLHLAHDLPGGAHFASYAALGIAHIAGGVDHLAFVFLLLLLAADRRTLIVTITAFTVAHSFTLIAAALGWLSLPRPPVEAAISLSIVFLAREALLADGSSRPSRGLRGWTVVFAFGLLHGLGFAGALSDIDLADAELLGALLFFNAGVEVGQLLFVLCLLLAGKWLAQAADIGRLRMAACHALGGGALAWAAVRVSEFAPA